MDAERIEIMSHETTGNIVRATMTAKDWRIVLFGANLYAEDYVSTEGCDPEMELTIEYDLDDFAWGEIDRKIGEAVDLEIVELIDYVDREGDPVGFDKSQYGWDVSEDPMSVAYGVQTMFGRQEA